MVGTICIASIRGGGPQSRRRSRVSFTLVVVFTAYINQFFEPISVLAQRYTLLQSAMAGAERVFELLDEPALGHRTRPRTQTRGRVRATRRSPSNT